VLCLDLSESMNEKSGVSRPIVRHGVLEDVFDHDMASIHLLDQLAKDISANQILENGVSCLSYRRRVLICWRTAKGYLQKQHPSCHQAWKFYLRGDPGSEDDSDYTDFERPVYEFLRDLGAMAGRDALKLSLTLEANHGNFQMKNKMLEVRGPISELRGRIHEIYVIQSAHFATACDKQSIELADYLFELLEEMNVGEDGVEPYQVPRRLIDPKFGHEAF